MSQTKQGDFGLTYEEHVKQAVNDAGVKTQEHHDRLLEEQLERSKQKDSKSLCKRLLIELHLRHVLIGTEIFAHLLRSAG